MKRILTDLSRLVGFGVVASAILGITCPASAEPPRPEQAQEPLRNKEEARTRFGRGVELFREGNFAAALLEFRRAYDAVPNFNVLYNIGQTCIELADHASALRALEKYLEEGGSEIAPARRAEVERDIERLRARVGYLRIKVPSPNADVAVDDVVIGRSPIDTEIVVNAGRRKVTVNGGPLAALTRLVDVAVGEHALLALEDATPAPAATPPPAVPAPDTSVKEASSSNVPLWIGLVTTGALAAGTVVSGIVTLSAKSSLDDRVGTYPTTHRDVEEARNKATTWVTVTDVLGAATIVAAGVTTYIALTRKPATKPQTAIVVGPGSVVLSGRF